MCALNSIQSSVRPIGQGLSALEGTDQVYAGRAPNEQTLQISSTVTAI